MSPCRLFRVNLFFIFAVMFCPLPGLGTQLQPGKIYEGPDNIEVSELGFSFVIPKNWSGQLSPVTDLFIMENKLYLDGKRWLHANNQLCN